MTTSYEPRNHALILCEKLTYCCVLCLQIEAYIRSLGLTTMSNEMSTENVKKMSHRHWDEEVKTVKHKVGKKRRRDEHGMERKVAMPETSVEKSVKTKKKRRAENSNEQEQSKEEIEKQLMNISVTPHTRLLVSPDSEQLWFDQVCPYPNYNLPLCYM